MSSILKASGYKLPELLTFFDEAGKHGSGSSALATNLATKYLWGSEVTVSFFNKNNKDNYWKTVRSLSRLMYRSRATGNHDATLELLQNYLASQHEKLFLFFHWEIVEKVKAIIRARQHHQMVQVTSVQDSFLRIMISGLTTRLPTRGELERVTSQDALKELICLWFILYFHAKKFSGRESVAQPRADLLTSLAAFKCGIITPDVVLP